MPHASARQRAASQAAHVAELVRLHHRRRGWAFVAVGSLIGLVVYAGIGFRLLDSLTGAAAAFSYIPFLVLLALALTGLVVAIVDTARIRRAEAAVQASARRKVSHHPVYAHAHRWPPRHRGSWVAGLLMLAAMTSIAVFYLPAEVNAVGYVVGAERLDTFHPLSYGQSCSGIPRHGGCHTVTEGYLSNTGQHVAWNTQVPLGQPFGVRDPLWIWGSGQNITSGMGSAIPTVIAGLFFDGLALLLVYVLVVLVRESDLPVRAGGKPARR